MNHITDQMHLCHHHILRKKSQYFFDVFLHQTWTYPDFQTTFLADVTYILTIVVDMKAVVSYAQ